jgi:hypothetical protein
VVWLTYATFVVSLLTLGGLVWYVCETRRIRLASQQQLEALRRPCLVVCARLRDPNDAIMRPDSPLLVVAPHEGLVALMNIGTGPAFNATYQLIPLDEGVRHPSSHHLVHVLNHEANPVPVPIQTVSNGNWTIRLTYESISKTLYETKTTIESGVLIGVQHRQIASRKLESQSSNAPPKR